MTGLVYGEQPPPILPVAHSVLDALLFHRAFGTVPDHVAVRVYIVEDEGLMVALGGLGNEFILGPRARELAGHRDVLSEFLTEKALTFRRAVWELIRPLFPVRSDGEPFFGPVVWLQTEPFAQLSATHHDQGVIILNRGEFS
jgi:hypothetical protein